MERHRSQARVAVPQLADHGVTAPELGEAAPVHVKRQDAFDLGDDPVLVVDVAGELDRDGAAPLPDGCADRRPVDLGGESQAQHPWLGSGVGPAGWGEALEETGAGGQVERAAHSQLGGHRAGNLDHDSTDSEVHSLPFELLRMERTGWWRCRPQRCPLPRLRRC